jgi:methyl-accepting chemotaxis protein
MHVKPWVNLLNLARTLFTQSDEVKKVISSEKVAVEKSSAAAHEISSMVETTASAAQELSKTAQQSNTSLKALSNL